jgi:hypothetical protein
LAPVSRGFFVHGPLHQAAKPGPETNNQQLGGIRSLSELSAAVEIRPHNPLKELPGAKDKKRAIRRLLATPWEHNRAMAPYFAVCYFVGLRPDSEARRLGKCYKVSRLLDLHRTLLRKQS